MENKISLQKNETIEINGAILTTIVIEQIKSFQDYRNECLDSSRKHIADAICFIAKESIDYSGLDKESFQQNAFGIIADLSYLRDYLKELEKPYVFEKQTIDQ